MEVSPRPRRRGAGLVFILLAVIAMLAIAIVLLSQLTHRDPAVGNDKSLSNGIMDNQSHSDMETVSNTGTSDVPGSSSPKAIEYDNAETPALAFPPPPPPAIATPDAAHLPPEG